MQLHHDHVHLLAADAEAVEAWLVAHLGAQVLGRLDGAKPRVDLNVGGLLIYLSPQANAAGTGIVNHLAFRVENVDETIAGLVRAGVRVASPPATTRPGLRTAFIEGPEGLRVELLASVLPEGR